MAFSEAPPGAELHCDYLPPFGFLFGTKIGAKILDLLVTCFLPLWPSLAPFWWPFRCHFGGSVAFGVLFGTKIGAKWIPMETQGGQIICVKTRKIIRGFVLVGSVFLKLFPLFSHHLWGPQLLPPGSVFCPFGAPPIKVQPEGTQ